MRNTGNLWILASAENPAGNSEGETIGMEDTSQDQQVVTQQDGGNGAVEGESTNQQRPTGFGATQLIFLLVIVAVMYLMMFRGPRKKQQEHQKMVASLTKNDRVRTIGGIFGTVLDVRDDEILLKVDESTNTKMRVTPGAIATVLKEGKNQ